jgi:hypothetical protein
MPTPDASQFTQLKKYSAISESEITSTGTKTPNRFNGTYIPSFLSTRTLFLPSINKDTKIAIANLPVPGYAGALQFTNSATPSYLQVNSKASLFPGTQSFTISLYLYVSSAGGFFSRVFALRYPPGSGYAGLELMSLLHNKGENQLNFRINEVNRIVVSYAGNLDSWHFINIYGTSGTSIRLEIDGVLQGTFTGAYNIANTNNRAGCVFEIGNNGGATQTTASLQGSLANFRLVVGAGLSLIPKPSPPLPFIPEKTPLLLLANTEATAFVDSGTDSGNTVLTVVGPSSPTWSSQFVV